MHTLYDYRLYQNQHAEQLRQAQRERESSRAWRRVKRAGSRGSSAGVHQERGRRAH